MGIQVPKVYVDEPRQIFNPLFLSDEEYERATRALIIVCTDVGLIDVRSKTIWLARRSSRPAQNQWWFIGGRTRIGETETESIQRCFKRETGLLIPKNRFNFVCMNRFFWKDRQQLPHEAGCDCLAYTMALQLSHEERAQIVLDRNEYQDGGLRAFSYDSLKAEGIHQYIRDFCEKVFEPSA